MKKLIFISIGLLFILMGNAYLMGQEQLKAKGKLMLPAWPEHIAFQGTFTVNLSDFEFDCEQKIFRLFNRFDLMTESKFKVAREDIAAIRIQQNTVFIFTENVFTRKFRNLFSQVWIYGGLYTGELEFFALIFKIDDQVLLKKIGKGLEKLCPKKEWGRFPAFKMEFFP